MTARDLTRELEREARTLLEEVRAFLASPEGQRFRAAVATGLIVAAPIIARLPVFQASRLGRLIGLAGGAALIVKVAHMIRDWEPQPAQTG